MAIPSEVRRVQAAIDNHNHKELEWSLWYARMRQTVPSARPADVKYWSAVEQQVDDILNPPPPRQNYPTRKKKKEARGLGLSPLPGEATPTEMPIGTHSLDAPANQPTPTRQRELPSAKRASIKRPTHPAE